MELKPGYKRTEVGVLPEEWVVKKLGALVSYTNGKAHEKVISDSGRYVVVNSKFISSKGLIRKYSNHRLCPTSTGDVLMVMSDIPKGRAIAKCYWVETDQTYTVNQRVCALTAQSIDGKLLFYKLDRNPFYLAFDDGAKQTNLRKDDVLSCPLGIPKSVDEQRAIAAAISDMDVLIGTLDQLIAKKRDLKQATMQQLLTGGKRLPGFYGQWRLKPLGDVAHVDPDNLGSNTAPDYEFNYISLEDVDSGVLRSFSVQVFISAPSRARRRLQNRDILVSTVRPNLKSHLFFDIDDPHWVCSTGFAVVRCKKGVMHPRYVFSQLFGHGVSQQIEALLTGSNYPAISSGDVRALRIPFPEYEEQAAIATVLSDMDTELTALEQRRDKTCALKQGMMQELLTGRTRMV